MFKRYINFSKNFTLLSSPVTLKMRSRSVKSNQLLSLSKCYIYVSLEKIHPLLQEIFYIQEYDLENGVKVTKNFRCLKSVTTIYPLTSDDYLSICSRNTTFLAIKSLFVSWLVTLKMGSRSSKYSKHFKLSLKYNCASLVVIKTKMQEIYHF